jgi:hypothetical protein
MSSLYQAETEFPCPIREEAWRNGSGTAHQRDSIRLTGLSPGTPLEERNFNCNAYMPSVCQASCNHDGYCPSFRVLSRFMKRTKSTTGYCDFIQALENIPLKRYQDEIKRMEREWWKQTVGAARAAEKSLVQLGKALVRKYSK